MILGCLVCLSELTGDASQRADVAAIGRLDNGAQLQRPFAGGTSQTFAMNLIAGEFLHLTVEQLGVDVVVELAGPKGTALTQDSPNGQFGIECVAYVAADSGEYRVNVTSFEGGADTQSGRIDLRVIARRVATDEDKVHAEIERALAGGQELRVKNTAATRATAIELFQTALRLSRESRLPHEQSLAAYGIGFTYLRGGASREAIPYIEEAFGLFRDLGVPMYASAATALGGAFDTLGDIRKARRTIAKLSSTMRNAASFRARELRTTTLVSSTQTRQSGNSRSPNTDSLCRCFAMRVIFRARRLRFTT